MALKEIIALFRGLLPSGEEALIYPVTKIECVEGLQEKLEDYIVAQGTSGIWTYRKWNSGIAECRCKYDVIANCTKEESGIIYADVTLPVFPFTFTSVSYINVYGFSTTGSCLSMSCEKKNVTNNTLGLMYANSFVSNRQMDLTVCAFVFGKWK